MKPRVYLSGATQVELQMDATPRYPHPAGDEPPRMGNRPATGDKLVVLERAYAAALSRDMELLAGITDRNQR